MGAGWTIEQVATCPSTNVELVRRAKAGEVLPPFALIALEQTAGQGRNGRTWVTPPRGAITLSALVDPATPRETWGLFPLFAALAVCRALKAAGFPAVVKWPNDILLPDAEAVEGFGNYRKVAGILCQVVPGVGMVVGIGINVTLAPSELPVPTATALSMYGPVPDSGALRTAILDSLAEVIDEWETNGDEQLRNEFAGNCITIGQSVVIHPELTETDDAVTSTYGIGRSIAHDGGLVIETDDGQLSEIHAGDVWLRASSN